MAKKLKVLVTAGSTTVPIDQVRNISNIFRGGTGAAIARLFEEHDMMDVTLVTSNRDIWKEEGFGWVSDKIKYFNTYDELIQIMWYEIRNGNYDVIIHSAAVSDYYVHDVCLFEGNNLISLDKTTKVSSNHEDVFLRLRQTHKIIDLIRKPWGFKGYLVKFKLQVGIDDEELLKIATKSRITSEADMIVANCLEWAKEKAYVITDNETVEVSREILPEAIYKKVREALS
ncbi:MAG: bifunctional phosphopantothenoylcysteine decarboxylase/phosphopantothenate synthase [Candidatus Falkowbacteria bacterium]|nr:bifunctional phosphopantothenoylcysteine decarboxylase/phosphopantothenate synthase [Candidatus Falkowbacteria bacterium]